MKETSKVKSKSNLDISYSDALKELEEILTAIESGDTDIDTLSEQVKRAFVLVKICKAKLKSTDEEISKILNEFKDLNTSESKD